MLNTWRTDYLIGNKRHWKCDNCQNLVPYSYNNMNFCGHCGEPKYYTVNDTPIYQPQPQRAKYYLERRIKER